mmetsp:Transcript_33404/g.85349  ORF Transcript_33404/g.85349 Transcript_33404/m.85349 type:complete len:258 (+) Transcript_33404:476-1249(+)
MQAPKLQHLCRGDRTRDLGALANEGEVPHGLVVVHHEPQPMLLHDRLAFRTPARVQGAEEAVVPGRDELVYATWVEAQMSHILRVRVLVHEQLLARADVDGAYAATVGDGTHAVVRADRRSAYRPTCRAQCALRPAALGPGIPELHATVLATRQKGVRCLLQEHQVICRGVAVRRVEHTDRPEVGQAQNLHAATLLAPGQHRGRQQARRPRAAVVGQSDDIRFPGIPATVTTCRAALRHSPMPDPGPASWRRGALTY